uniref:Uncharacterized protein n=1 Tax=Anopheles melas TaxID=34690 RepID=A0A182UK90_9DIPT
MGGVRAQQPMPERSEHSVLNVQLDGRHLAGCRFAYHQVKLSAPHISNHGLYLVHRLEVTGSDRSNLHNLIPHGNALKRGMRVLVVVVLLLLPVCRRTLFRFKHLCNALFDLLHNFFPIILQANDRVACFAHRQHVHIAERVALAVHQWLVHPDPVL